VAQEKKNQSIVGNEERQGERRMRNREGQNQVFAKKNKMKILRLGEGLFYDGQL